MSCATETPHHLVCYPERASEQSLVLLLTYLCQSVVFTEFNQFGNNSLLESDCFLNESGKGIFKGAYYLLRRILNSFLFLPCFNAVISGHACGYVFLSTVNQVLFYFCLLISVHACSNIKCKNIAL